MKRVFIQWILALTVSALLMGLVLADAAHAQQAAGDWHGAIRLPTGDHRLAVQITGAPGAFAGTVASPEVSDRVVPLADVRLDGDALSFAVPSIHATYKGRWDAASKSWIGQWSQGQDFPVTLEPGKLPPRPVVAGLDGAWSGVITNPAGAKLRVVLHIRTGAGGTIVLMDSPDQLAYGIPVTDLTRDGQKVAFGLKIAQASYAGVLSADGRSIAGTWTQGASAPLTFTRQAEASAQLVRPQTPKPPFPYRAEEVSVPSAPGVRLAGTLTLPQGKGPFPAVVMITGSGAQDRDETILGHKPFAVIADRLTRDGIAVLRVDDRGTAGSTGDFAKATDDDFAVDTAAQVAFLRKRSDIDPARIGLIGHSEGGLVAPKVAARDPKVAFIVLMAGPGVPLSEVLRAQRAALAPAMGASPEVLRRSQALMDHVDAAMKGARDDADAEARALTVIKAEAGPLAPSPAAQAMIARQLANGWMRSLVDYDPRPTLAKVRCPILALNGSKDGQVPPDQNLPAIRAATKANPDVTIMELPNLNHLFQSAGTGAVGEYADIQETVAPIALDAMSGWIRKHVIR
jgi:pimeloyl-ACP methyl ester carboxylesterase